MELYRKKDPLGTACSGRVRGTDAVTIMRDGVAVVPWRLRKASGTLAFERVDLAAPLDDQIVVSLHCLLKFLVLHRLA